MPKLSVIIATYRRPDLLLKAIKSVQKQDFKDLEIIVSDDNSKDETEKLVKQMQEKDSRIKYVLNTRYKQGPNGNKNNGLDYAQGEFISFLDDDDELLDGALSELLSKEGYSHILGNCLIEENGVLSSRLSGVGLDKDTELCKKDFLMQKFQGEFFSVFKKSLLKGKRFNENFYGNEATLWVNLYDEKSFYIHKAFRIYRIKREDSVTLNAAKNAHRVYLGYLELALLLETQLELSKDKDYKKACASYYKMAAYYAKFAGEFKKMYFYLYKSLKIKFNLPALILLCLSIIPSSFIAKLSRIRVALCKN
ncbi:glycosyltransferase family 2 protein [Campylobacter cuniculorum]|uniref:GalNAc5-diNAcBac-PP-undecaprenol beta-1,3-glucosyltransferase n=2 Tax=Campylobacter cuniculorum TaxID=374106 RepID=A0A1W6BXE9_9BACT|nr:glycosyltransferase family 2 protein [Campylobacter cuniculorum]ARJ56762.1 GalNAc5-diNAcBac-PP-undecaprenol beta-1,3-glucosyltransferase [Campylobacter cuniculorum DSM 23162 = LMG 24588]QOR04232.1 glycosyltransferase family 2 protein [Campylobacter cuniculorum]